MSDTTLREAIEALAEDFDSEIDWSNGRSNYGDNAAWESAARRVRAVLAEHPATSAESCGVAYGHNPDPCYLADRHTGPHSNRWGATWEQ